MALLKAFDFAFSATFDKDGKWLKTESYIKASALPKNIRDYVTKNFPGYSTDDAEKVETPEKVTYDMVVTKDDLSYDISLSPDAILLKHEQKGEPKDEPK